jgi:hypothetical protein
VEELWRAGSGHQKCEMRGDVSPDQNALSLDDRLSDNPNGHQALSCNEGSEGARGVQEVKLFLLKLKVKLKVQTFFEYRGIWISRASLAGCDCHVR